ncbi:ribosomal RNA-processing protein 15-like isoform X1 [Salvia splendens]|uniref:ribosomal RNA-processing protein 15-like isoform X1 n=1 Tax=Salvia splendens TaxID=180675 RepID=UPI001C258F0E|nr:ribosomal RNA-processing protein 15-like isoform X1 [Salvia splendens]
MAEATQSVDVKNIGRKRKSGKKKGIMAKKRQRMHQGGEKKVKINPKTRKLYQKRARDYNSDDTEEDEEPQQAPSAVAVDESKQIGDGFDEDGDEEDEGFEGEEEEVSEDESSKIQPGIVRFSEGIKAFKSAFKKIVKKSGGDEDVLGPVLSANKKLIAEKLAEEDLEKKVKGEAKKERHIVIDFSIFVIFVFLIYIFHISEKGHVKPADYLDAHEKLLLGVATKGVVKLFNAVNKAQNAQKGLNPLRTKDEKVIKQRRKEAFFTELGRTSTQAAATVIKVGSSSGPGAVEAPAWAPLRDNYMLTNPKLKDWDKMQDANAADDFGRTSDVDSSSDDSDA